MIHLIFCKHFLWDNESLNSQVQILFAPLLFTHNTRKLKVLYFRNFECFVTENPKDYMLPG